MTDERLRGLIALLDNRQMPDHATPKVTLGELRSLHAALAATLEPTRTQIEQHYIDHMGACGEPNCERGCPPPSATPEPTLDGRAVHAAWRDGMLRQGREVAPERMTWETLTEQDRALDDWIAARLSQPTQEPS